VRALLLQPHLSVPRQFATNNKMALLLKVLIAGVSEVRMSLLSACLGNM
jgi:hypothetical protein